MLCSQINPEKKAKISQEHSKRWESRGAGNLQINELLTTLIITGKLWTKMPSKCLQLHIELNRISQLFVLLWQPSKLNEVLGYKSALSILTSGANTLQGIIYVLYSNIKTLPHPPEAAIGESKIYFPFPTKAQKHNFTCPDLRARLKHQD